MLQVTEGDGDLIIFGTGETASIAYEYFTHDSKYNVVGFSVDDEFFSSESYLGLPVIPLSKLCNLYPKESTSVFVAMAPTKLNRSRAKAYKEIKNLGYSCPTYISSKSFVWHSVVIGENSMIFEGNVLQHGVRVGDNVILWSGNHIGHQTVIGNHCFISSHCVISGFCQIGDYSYLGVNCTFRDEFTLARDCVVAMGATMLKDTESGKIYQGTPAEPNEKKSAYDLFNVAETEIDIM